MILTIFIILSLFTKNLSTQNIDLRVELDRDQLIFGETLKINIQLIPRLLIKKLKLDLKLNSSLNFTVDHKNLICSSKCEEIFALRDPTENYQILTLLNDTQLIYNGTTLTIAISLPNMEATPLSTFDQVLFVNASFAYFNGSMDFIVDTKNFTLKPMKIELSFDTVVYKILKINEEIILRSQNQSNEMIFIFSKQWRKMIALQIHIYDTCVQIFCNRTSYCNSSRILLEPETLYANFAIDFRVKNQQCQDLLNVGIKLVYDNSSIDIGRIDFRQPVANVDCSIKMVPSKKSYFEADDTVEYKVEFYHPPNSTADATILYTGLDINSSTGLTVDRYVTLYSDKSELVSEFIDGFRPGILLRNQTIVVKFRVKFDSTVVLGSLLSFSFVYDFETIMFSQDQKCLPRECKNGGVCGEFHGVPVCTCVPGYTGDACEQKTCPYNWIFVPLNQACYFIDSANRSYFDAQIRCLSLGGAIAGMDSYSDFISLNILHKKYNFSRGLWLGYNTFLQEEIAHETKSTWFHVEYVSGQSVPSKEDCLSFSADESKSKVVIKEPCQELKPYVCIDKRNYVKSHSKIVPLIVQISQPKIRATFSQNDDDQLFTCTVEIFLPKGTLRNCNVNFDFEPPNINISIFGSCLVLPTGVYSSVNSTTCGSYQWSNLHNLPTMVSGGDINPVVYNATFIRSNDLYRIKLYFVCGNESQLINEKYFGSSSPKLEFTKFVTVDPQDKRLKIVANIKHMINSTETAYNIRYEDDLTNLKIQSPVDQCTINKSNNRLCYSKDQLTSNETLNFSYDVSADQNLTFDPFYFNSILNYSSLKPGVVYSEENSRKRTSIEISTCIVRNEDIVINEVYTVAQVSNSGMHKNQIFQIKTDKQSLLILFSSTFLVSIFAIMAILGLFCKFCRTKDSKVEINESSQSAGKPNDNINFEDQCLNNSHDTVTSMDSQDDRSIETNIPRLIAIWLKNSNIGQEMIDKILVDVENSILKFKIRARKEERKIKDYLMKTYCSFELSKNQKSNIEFVATKFIHCKMWHEICTKIHSILETNVHQGQQLCRIFFRLLQNQLAMQSMRRRLSKIQQGMLRSMLDAMKETAMEYCSRALKNQERFQNNIESVFDSAVVEFQLLNDVMQKHIFEKQEVEMCNFYSIFENLGVEPDKWLPKIREIRSKLLIKINEQDNQLKTEQYFQILEKFIEKCSSLPSLQFQEEESLKNLKAALIFKMMQMKEKMMQIELNFDQELKKLEQKLENRVHIVPQYTRKAMSLSRDEQSLLLYCENDLSTMIGDVEKFSCHVIDSGDQIDHDQDQKFEGYLQYFFAKQQASKVDQLSQLKFDTWCLETLISCLISYISKYKLTTESILQKVRDDHDVEFNFLYNHLLNKKQEEENNEEKELKKKAAHGHIYDFGDQGLSAEQYAKQKEVQNFMLEQEINDMKRLCKLKMEKRLIEEKQTLVAKLVRISQINSTDAICTLKIFYPEVTKQILLQKFDCILNAAIPSDTEITGKLILCEIIKDFLINSRNATMQQPESCTDIKFSKEKITPRFPTKLPPLTDPRLSSRTITILSNNNFNYKLNLLSTKNFES